MQNKFNVYAFLPGHQPFYVSYGVKNLIFALR
jgi:hypothetical protein